ncbi:MAG: hypothetical protein ABI871_04555, partial [Chthoniobacterales bacterium]
MSNETAVLDQVMEAEPPSADSAAAILSGFPRSQNLDLPSWFQTEQRAAWSEFTALPMPSRRDQAWRFANVDALELSGYHHPEPLAEDERAEICERSRALQDTAARLVFADDQLLLREALPEKLRGRGVIFQPLERAMIEHEDLFRR